MSKMNLKKLIIIMFTLLFLSDFVFAASKETREKIVEIAKQQIGTYYENTQYGSWPPGLDCSGLVDYAYLQAGVTGFEGTTKFSHGPNTTSLVTMSTSIDVNDLLPGDLLFQHGTYDKNQDGKVNLNDQYSHVGIYIGNNQVIQAGVNGVEIITLSRWMNPSFGTFAGARRIKAEYWPNNDNGYVSEPQETSQTFFQQIEETVQNIFSPPYFATTTPPEGLVGEEENLSFWDKVAFYWNGFVANVKELFGGTTGEVQVATPLTQTEIQQQTQQTNQGIASSASPPRNDNGEATVQPPAENSSPPSQPSETWDQKFISYKLDEQDKVNGIYKLTLNFQNTGNTTWTKDDVSLNIVGGNNGTAAKFYHQSWITKLRPAKLTQATKPGDIANFTFLLQFPKEPGTYYPQFRPVRYIKDTNSFSWIGSDKAIFLAEVKESSPDNFIFAGASLNEIINNIANNNTNQENQQQNDNNQQANSSPPIISNIYPPQENSNNPNNNNQDNQSLSSPSEESSQPSQNGENQTEPLPPQIPSFTYSPQREYQETTFVAKGESITFDASTIDLSSFDNKSISYTWDFGDDNSTLGEGGEEENEGIKVSHIFSTPGTYAVTLTVKDDTNTIIKTFTQDIIVKQLTAPVQWQKLFGGDKSDLASSVQETKEGGYIIIGNTNSYGSGLRNIWLIKTDSNGNEVWEEKKIFGEENEYYYAASGQQTLDGKYIIVGEKGFYYTQALLIKVDADGDELKELIIEPPRIAPTEGPYQGIYLEGGSFSTIQQTSDGGYIIVGYAYHPGLSYSRIWLIKLKPSLEVEWKDKVFEIGSSASSVQQTKDGGYVLGGITYRNYDKNEQDVLLIKTNSKGEEEFSEAFGGSKEEGVGKIQQTSDGGYIILSTTYSYGNGGSDILLIKTDFQGKEIWRKTFGGPNDDWANTVQQTKDGGYIIVGGTYSYSNNGQSDIWIIKTDSQGNELWNKTFQQEASGSYGVFVQQTSDQGYIILGNTDNDIWLIKLGPEVAVEEEIK